MSASDASSIRYGCPNCSAILTARADDAGMRCRCPSCYTWVEVPGKSAVPTDDAYALQTGASQSERAPSEVPFFCHVCHTRMTAPPSEAGRKVACPDCGTTTTVPRPSASARREFAPVEEYRMLEDRASGAVPAPVEPAPQVRVYCTLCNSLIYANADQVGSTVTCPDCHTETRVVAPPKASSATAPANDDSDSDLRVADDDDDLRLADDDAEVYSFRDEPNSESDASTGEPAFSLSNDPPTVTGTADRDTVDAPIPAMELPVGAQTFHCTTCGSLLYATQGQSIVVCHDCFAGVIVPPPKTATSPRRPVPPPPPPRSAGETSSGRQMLLFSDPSSDTKVAATSAQKTRRDRTDRAGRDRRVDDLEYDPDLQGSERPFVERPMTSGILTFPWHHGCRIWWVSLILGIFSAGALTVASAHFAGQVQVGAGYMAMGPGIIALILAAGAMVVGLSVATVFALAGLSILSDTAAGNDRIENWPDAIGFFDGIGSAFFVFNAGFLSCVAGAGLAALFREIGWEGVIGYPVAIFVLFPLLLLSMLDNASPLLPVSLNVFGSLWWRAGAWTLFYVQSFVIFALAGAAVWATLRTERLLLVSFVAATALATVGMIYFRLLGRVAWCCSDMAQEEDDDEGDEEVEEAKWA